MFVTDRRVSGTDKTLLAVCDKAALEDSEESKHYGNMLEERRSVERLENVFVARVEQESGKKGGCFRIYISPLFFFILVLPLEMSLPLIRHARSSGSKEKQILNTTNLSL